MLLLVTILLVLIAAVTLLIGIFSDNLALIFISIGASALAAIVLGVLSQVSKRKGREATASTGPEPLPAREPATVGGGRQAEQAAASIAEVGQPVGAPSDATTTMPKVSAAALPIAGYDTLRVNEILPALESLDLDQLEAVAQHEEANKNRTTVLNRIDDRMDELEAQESTGAPADDLDDVEAAAVESIADVGEPVGATAGAASSDGFPIPDYDDLDEDELIARFEDLDADALEAVADREEAGQNRDAVLDAIDDRLDILEGIVPAPAAKAAAATKAPAKKAPAKKSAVTPPTATRKAATPAKRPAPAPAKRSTPAASSRKAAAPAKKTTPKAPAKKATATAAKATKKAATTAKKAAPVKKATAAKKASKR